MQKPLGGGMNILKLCFGTGYLLLLGGLFWLLRRMAQVRAGMEHVGSSLFLARALVLISAAACLVMAVWCFASLKIHIRNVPLRILAVSANALCGAACLAFYVFTFASVQAEYALWPGGALF